MGKLKNIEIFFDNNKNVYYPGDCISGNIMVESRGEIKINTLKVYIRGIAKVHWTETKTAGYRLGNYTEHYRSEVEYISLKQTLIGGKGKRQIWLPCMKVNILSHWSLVRSRVDQDQQSPEGTHLRRQ